MSAARSIRRFSSFGHVVGHVLSRLNANRSPPPNQPRHHLAVPNAIQSATISEDTEGEAEQDVNNNIKSSVTTNGPTIITPRDSHNDTGSRSNSIEPPEDINSPDGLRSYLERMISTGKLPGGGGPPEVTVTTSDEE